MKTKCEICEKEKKDYSLTAVPNPHVEPPKVDWTCSNGHTWSETESLKDWKPPNPTMDDVRDFIQMVMPMVWELQEKVKKLEIHTGHATYEMPAVPPEGTNRT